MDVKKRLLPGIPLIESPLFDSEIAQAELTPGEHEIAVALNRNGYAVIDFPDPEFDARIARIRERLTSKFADTGLSPEGVFYASGRIQDAWINDPDVKEIATNRALLDLLGRLYGRTAFPFQTLNFRVGTQQKMHTDAVHFSSIPQRFMCGVWVALEDISAEAGPLQLVPGSHNWPMIDNAMAGRQGFGVPSESAQLPYQEIWDAMVEAKAASIKTFEARKGQALIWCANLLHGGSLQIDPAMTRWSQVTHYFFDDCIYYTPAFSDEYLGRLQLRNLVSVVDGTRKRNSYLGEEITPPARTSPRASRALVKKLRKWMKSS
ncbi:TPA: phytanoyl-CoA dioxygenase family protein [Burkholderia cepacia ATCC 25416]|uniref:phytanoyl-CoA dioxygenase family protein n=1 Tax=Burkholderia cepacia TaxID=292 RepID=UPI000F5E6260|nr:phytanoyl-CoA dioxygenase family protein [Burkholderia cepacia]HDR9765358.1 phytanoyl-CoA dioxygenase family protein [Burkholderia cepacia ATCC 25416]RRA25092.1 phytanoyl-CoA dioxygenase [Burkholderia cepacia]HDR9772747.1 phytanoyl-CoA dioxygenase family protein [Burkholderia cepacia ATCC 25416]HDR9781268.1 phytanoyl-CoA dioxygenase family protein [Burkholderia cepacia ATCC 25416]HDR9789260.1 phytanoyl-CoA dioxygenase family protein [Burkholderia cepacia ATCC 25416]